jgi:hypothetical protein
LPAVVEDALALRVELQAPVRERFGERALGLEVQVLDALRRERPADDVGAPLQSRFRFAAANDRAAEHVVVLWIDARRPGFDRALGIQDRLEQFVCHDDEIRGRARRALVIGCNRGQHVADAAHFLADSHESRPIGVQESVPALARDVRRRRDRAHPG